MTAQEAAESALLAGSKTAATKAVAFKALTTLDPFPLDGSVHTLGWGVVDFVESWLLQPDGDEAATHTASPASN